MTDLSTLIGRRPPMYGAYSRIKTQWSAATPETRDRIVAGLDRYTRACEAIEIKPDPLEWIFDALADPQMLADEVETI